MDIDISHRSRARDRDLQHILTSSTTLHRTMINDIPTSLARQNRLNLERDRDLARDLAHISLVCDGYRYLASISRDLALDLEIYNTLSHLNHLPPSHSHLPEIARDTPRPT